MNLYPSIFLYVAQILCYPCWYRSFLLIFLITTLILQDMPAVSLCFVHSFSLADILYTLIHVKMLDINLDTPEKFHTRCEPVYYSVLAIVTNHIIITSWLILYILNWWLQRNSHTSPNQIRAPLLSTTCANSIIRNHYGGF